MIDRPSGISGIMAAAAAAGPSDGPAPRKKRAKGKPPVVRCGGAQCGACGEEGHGFNECPKMTTAAQIVATNGHAPTDALPAVTIGGAEALTTPAFFTPDGWLSLPRDLPFEAYRELVARFAHLRKNMLWIAGDLQVQGHALYGESHTQVLDLLAAQDYTESTLSVARTVSERFPAAERESRVSWNHHVKVMALPKAERTYWLKRAADENLSIREMMAQIDAAKPARVAAKPKAKPKASEQASQRDADGEDDGGAVLDEAFLLRLDMADKAFFDAMEPCLQQAKRTGKCDGESLRAPAIALRDLLDEVLRTLA